VLVNTELPPVLAVGGHLKNTVAIAVGRQVFLSQHVGDLDTLEARQAFEAAIHDLCRLYRFEPQLVACDLHPDYASTRWARASGLPVIPIQHHQAHAAACAAENGLDRPYLAVSWDGTGYGLDGTVWGGEFFRFEDGRFERVAHLRPFRLPGGEAAVREGWRCAASLLWEAGLKHPDPVIARMLERGVNAPPTTSVGRLFDAVASLAGVAHRNGTEGQAAMLLESALDTVASEEAYPLPAGDWEPLVRAVVDDTARGAGPALIAARFHNALTHWILEVALETGLPDVVLSGGCFLNGYLVERAAALLEQRGFTVHTHHSVPPGDGGIALGQAVLAGMSQLCA
jgi:hydrogenase maturation protein HypF